MEMWSVASDSLNEARRAAGGEPTADQLLQIAQIEALLAIAQNLSEIHHEGINPEFRAD
ncbi:hypothetical protein [Jannaschia sp. R86511]|uniref:hypothetical protein n=1 Tax=Jannaschia sp. R86511 TaxID=3093853 RepID=UPI0036D24E5A